MEKEIIKRMIAEKQAEIAGIELIKRPVDLEPAANYVFIGLRRAGKSYLMYQHIQDLIRSGQNSVTERAPCGTSIIPHCRRRNPPKRNNGVVETLKSLQS